MKAALYHPVRIGGLQTAGNVFLAPVAGWSDRAFRSLCVQNGADFTYTELISAEALVRGSMKTDYLIRNAPENPPYGIQLFGAKPETIAAAMEKLPSYQPALIDLNAGCPVPKVTRTGAGSALMTDPLKLAKIVKAMRRAAENVLGGIPVTVKMRLGWDASTVNCAECAVRAVDEGAALICLHPRTRAQGYAGKSDWTQIARLKQMLAVPIAGSGGLETPEDAARMLAETGCDCVMFARGAMGDPFIFSKTRLLLLNGAYEQTPAGEGIAAAFAQLAMMARDTGERHACLEMRKTFCAYTKGIPGGAALRGRLTQAQTIEDYKTILETASSV